MWPGSCFRNTLEDMAPLLLRDTSLLTCQQFYFELPYLDEQAIHVVLVDRKLYVTQVYGLLRT